MTRKTGYFQILKLILTFFGVLSFVGAVIYRLYALDWPGVITSVALSIAVFIPLARLLAIQEKKDDEKNDEHGRKTTIEFTKKS